MTEVVVVATGVGPARVHIDEPPGPVVGELVLGHGAGGSVSAPDLLAASRAGLAAGWRVVLVEQPYRVAGRRSPPAAGRLDLAWTGVLGQRPDLPRVVGGRSSGARVACRTAGEVGALGVVCLAFPWHPPGRPERSRAKEVLDVAVPVLVVQGGRDSFGPVPDAFADPGVGPARRTVVVAEADDHSLRRSADLVAEAVASWLTTAVAA